jgi:hypothetical protein
VKEVLSNSEVIRFVDLDGFSNENTMCSSTMINNPDSEEEDKHP